jgi:hypothetical protein
MAAQPRPRRVTWRPLRPKAAFSKGCIDPLPVVVFEAEG